MNDTSSRKASGRWRRRKDARPQEILDAALAVFAEKGFSAARMEEIAQRAGVTKGTIYLYFPGKEAVFKALLSESLGAEMTRVEEAIAASEAPADELIRMALGRLGEFMRSSDRVVLPKIVIAEAGNFPELVRFYRRELIDRGLQLLGTLIRKGIAQGIFRPLAVEHAARLCVAPILLSAVWRSTFAKFDAEPYDYAGLVKTHLDVLLRGFAAEGSSA